MAKSELQFARRLDDRRVRGRGHEQVGVLTVSISCVIDHSK